nr:glutamyl-tRNA reductase [Sabulibacter ruber]
MQVICLSHENASLAYREALQLSAPEANQFMLSLKQRGLVKGLVVVTTCNRTEVYFESEGTSTTLILEELLSFKKIENRAVYQKLFKNIRHSQDTFQYLLEVGIGLRSQVLGDRQIISQLKASYQQAHALQVTSPLLHQAFQSLFKTHKRVHNEASFRAGASSVGYAALERVTDFFPRKTLAQKKLLIIGIGQLGTDVARYAASFGFSHITLSNRTQAKAQTLASEVKARVLPFEGLAEQVASFDVIVSCVSGGEVLSLQNFKNLPEKRRVLLDLAVPLSFPAEVGQFPGISLVNMDELLSKTQAVQKVREDAIAEVKRIIMEDVRSFEDWLQDIPVIQTLQELRRYFATVLEAELQNHSQTPTPQLSQSLAEAALKKLLRRPAKTLRTSQGPNRQVLLESLQTLFHLA